MNLRISKLGVVGLVLATATAVFLFLFFLARFGGPAIRLAEPYELSADLEDTKGLSPRSDVLVRGVHVGEVEDIELRGDVAHVTIAMDGRYAPVHPDATVRVGSKTLFGESYVDLDLGGPGGGTLRSGTTLPPRQVLAAGTDVDQALQALNAPARRDLKASVRAFGEGAASAEAPEQVSQILGELSRATAELHRLTGVLRGQEGLIAGGVLDARTVLTTLGEREGELREIVAGGRATVAALASRSESLRSGLRELPALLASARTTLADARPLLVEARPVAHQLAVAAPPLNAALLDLGPVVDDANVVIAELPQLNASGIPFLHRAAAVLELAGPAVTPLGNALRNLVPVAGFLAARRDTFAAWFSNTGDLGSHRDEKGYFARFFVGFEPGTGFGTPGNFENNSYTKPHDAGDNQPYSGYPRLRPYDPPGR